MSFLKRIQVMSAAACCMVFAASALADDHHTNMLQTTALPVDLVHGDLSVMVLGSGGPLATTSGRASAGYIVFVDGKAKIIMDCGGGTYLRVGQSGASIKDVDTFLISHLHIDHMGDLPAIVKDMYFQNRVANVATTPINYPAGRTIPFNVFGPGANGAPFGAAAGILQDGTPPKDPSVAATTQYPSTSEFVNDMFNINTGQDRYLHIFSQMISAGVFAYTVTDVSPNFKAYNPEVIVNDNGLKITAVGVNHGPAPALAFRIDYKGHSIVYSGDTSSVKDNMISLSQDADLLIYDTSITDTLPNSGLNDQMFFALHTTPTRMGQVAAAAGVKKLVFSHLTPNTEPRMDEVESLVTAAGYTGEMSIANDLKVYNLDGDHDDMHR